MEALTAVTLIAAQYGARAVLRALTGGEDAGNLTAEVIGALAASEQRLEDRLARMQAQLDQVLEQRYVTAIKVGKRILSDPVPDARADVREEELRRARDAFREASASARTSLQEAVAERYLALCAVALGQKGAAEASIRRLDGLATEALLSASEKRASSRTLAVDAPKHDRSLRRVFDREGLIKDRADAIGAAAREEGTLAFRMIQESAVIGAGLADLAGGPKSKRYELLPKLSFYSAPPRPGWDYDAWWVDVAAAPSAREVIRVGAFFIRLQAFDVEGSGYRREVSLRWSIDIDPALSRSVSMWLMASGAQYIEPHAQECESLSVAGERRKLVPDKSNLFTVDAEVAQVRARKDFAAFNLTGARDLRPTLSLGLAIHAHLATLKAQPGR